MGGEKRKGGTNHKRLLKNKLKIDGGMWVRDGLDG